MQGWVGGRGEFVYVQDRVGCCIYVYIFDYNYLMSQIWLFFF